MSDAAPSSIKFSTENSAAFSDLMDFLVPEEAAPEATAGDTAPGAAGAGEGSPVAPAEGAAPATAATPAAPGGNGAGAAVPGEPAPAAPEAAGGEPAAGVAEQTGVGTADAADFASNWGEVLTGLEQSQATSLQQTAISEVRTEHPKYFEALEKHPRELVGTKVMSIDGSGREETLSSSADAEDWQNAVKTLLLRQVQDRVSRKAEDLAPTLTTLHEAVGLFQNNIDIVPGTKQFDAELVNEFYKVAKDYAVRTPDGKLIGFSVPVQPILNGIRSGLVAARAATKATPATTPAEPTAQQQRAAAQPRNDQQQFTNPDAPQAGIQSKAGASAAEAENYDTMFGVLGAAPGTYRV